MRTYTRGLSLLAAAGAACALQAFALGGPLHPVALTGTSGPLGPGLGAGVTFSNMVLVKTVHPEFGTTIPAAPSISGTGSIVFGGNLAGPGITTANGSGIWASRGGVSPSLVVRRGDQISGMDAGYTYGELFTPPQICDANTVVFQSMVDGPDVTVTSNEGTFTEKSGQVLPLILEGRTIVPETNGQGLFGLNSSNPTGDPWGNNQWVLNRHGDTALRCFVNAPSVGLNDSFGIYTDFGGPLSKHYRGADTYNDGTFSCTFMGCSNPRLNDSGAFLTARLSDVAFTTHPWTNRAVDGSGFGIPGVGQLRPIFIPNQTPAPGVPGSNFYSIWSLTDFHLNSNGRIAFAADLGGGGPGAPGGFWSDARFGALQLMALSGAAAPGLTGPVFNTNAQFILGSALSDNNCVVFQARLQPSATVGGSNDTGLWSTRSITTGQPGNLRLLLREGSPVPANAGPDYEGLNFGEISQFWVNASGRVAFMNLHNDFTNAVWMENADGTLSPIVKEFTLLDVSGNGSDMRLITNIELADNDTATGSGLRTAFNDNGDIALRIKFSDGSEGIFTTAPTPSCSAPSETVPPTSITSNPGATVQFTVGFTGSSPLRAQWRHDGVDIPGATSPQYTFVIPDHTYAGTYDCVLTNACGSVVSSPAILRLPGFPCRADFNNDGDIGTDADIQAFFACLAGDCCPRCSSADFNGDGDTGTDSDIESFFRVLSGGPC